jgi:hypothetical protein
VDIKLIISRVENPGGRSDREARELFALYPRRKGSPPAVHPRCLVTENQILLLDEINGAAISQTRNNGLDGAEERLFEIESGEENHCGPGQEERMTL